MHHLSSALAAERSRELHSAAERARLAAERRGQSEPARRPHRITGLVPRVVRLMARFAESGS